MPPPRSRWCPPARSWRELGSRGFANLGLWTRGVDTDLFTPERAIDLDLPRPRFVSVGRVAVEKNLEAFLSLDLPGTKIVIGHGPQEAELRARFPDAKFLGQWRATTLAAHLAAADVFVFPSKTDTFGIVQLEALASGVPVAAFPVTGPKDVIGSNPIGVLSNDLREACLGALQLSREACRAFALETPGRTARGSFWGTSVVFMTLRPSGCRTRAAAATAAQTPARILRVGLRRQCCGVAITVVIWLKRCAGAAGLRCGRSEER